MRKSLLVDVVRFEFRYLLRNPLMWLTAAATFSLFFAAMSLKGMELGSEGGMLENASYATVRNYMIISMFFMFVTTSFVANVVIRDDETGFGPIIRSTRISKFEYLIGRFLGAFAIAALCLMLIPLAVWVASLMPWADPATLGPFRIRDHLFAYFLVALPNVFVTSAVFFALATMTRSMMATYLGVVAFVSGYFSLEKALRGRSFIAYLDPFAARPIEDASRYWTMAERNVRLPDFAGALLYNRLLWIGVAIGCLMLAYMIYKFADRGISRRELKKQELAASEPINALRIRETATLPSPRPGHNALGSLIWMRTKFEVTQVIRSPAFAILMAWGLFITFFVLTTQRDPDGRPSYPTTLSMIPEIQDTFTTILLIVAIFYAGEVVWRERDRKFHEIIDSTPLPNWAYVVPKTIALLLVLIAMVWVNVLASVGIQLSLGYTHLELSKYLLWYVLPTSYDMLLLAALAIFVQSLSPHKVVGWGIMVLFLAWQEFNRWIKHDLLNYGATPEMPLSDLNGAGSFWKGAWTLRMYWGAVAVILLLVAHLLWRRGTNIRLKPRMRFARARLTGGAGLVGAVALVMLIATGGFAYYNINVLNEYKTDSEVEAMMVDFEKRYAKYLDVKQPSMTDLKLDIALYPEERRAITKGRTVLRNMTSDTISEIHVRLLYRDMSFTSAAVSDAELANNDEKQDYRIYRLNSPMRPGAERVLTFEARRWHRGFTNGSPNTRLVENGTFMTTNELIPVIGMSREGTLMDPDKRRKHGLPNLPPPPKLEDVSTTTEPSNGEGWTHTDITVSTSSDQTPIAPGRKVSDVTHDGRRTARFVSEAPALLLFSVQSARYNEKHRRHAGVDLGVYYHHAHAWNVDGFLDALAASLDYYQANFGPYQFKHVRIVEFPGYEYYAQAFPGTIAYSEDLDFISDRRAPETIDFATFVTAHE
ncbi:MAG TPA: ABC transporter permease, partial [Longimicrobiales bacterium]|nr:ABC transporter permease [Longimicrobiales bacterium]